VIYKNSTSVSDTLPSPRLLEKESRATQTQPTQSDELLTIAEVADYLKLSKRTAWRWCKSGHLPAVKVGHQWRVAQSDLVNFVRRRDRLVL
jgi:excisionase family DNA binding protein